MRSVLLYLAFLEGALVMSAELTGGAVVGPYYGNGLTVWTFVLGITMFSLAAGYFTGAVLLKFISSFPLIFTMVPFASFFLFLIPQIALGSIPGPDQDFEWQVFLGIFPVFFPTLFCSGIVSTALVQAYNEQHHQAGKSSGIIYGVSTLGGIVTSLLIGSVLFELLDEITLLLIFSFLAFTGTTLLALKMKSFRSNSLSLIAALFIGLVFANASAETEEQQATVLYKRNGVLGEVKVTRDNRDNTLMFYVNNSLQSTLGVNGYASLPYVKYICYFLSHRSKSDKVLLAGMGGGNIVRDLKSSGFSVDVVEMDKRVVDCATDYFGVDLNGSKLIVDDARHYINTTTKKYDIVVLDLSVGETIPSNVYTVESFEKIHGILNANGLITLHLFSTDKGSSLNSIKSLGKTMEAAGFNVYLLNTKIDPEKPSPFIFVASKSKIDFSGLNYSLYTLKGNRIFGTPDGDIRTFDFSDGIILSDDKPLLEIFQRDVVAYFRTSYLRDQSLAER